MIKILDILYPPKCIYCYQILGLAYKGMVCKTCKDELDQAIGLACETTGRPLNMKIYAVLDYSGAVRQAIHRFKYKNKPGYAIHFGELMALRLEHILQECDIMTEVPMYKSKLKSRGYNQAELLGFQMSKHSNTAFCKKLLIRTRNTKPQNILTPTARDINVKGAFAVTDAEKIKDKRIALIDDIFTTGSTMKACAEILLNNGAKEVVAICLSVSLKEKA